LRLQAPPAGKPARDSKAETPMPQTQPLQTQGFICSFTLFEKMVLIYILFFSKL
jgi:hypothetical protein